MRPMRATLSILSAILSAILVAMCLSACAPSHAPPASRATTPLAAAPQAAAAMLPEPSVSTLSSTSSSTPSSIPSSPREGALSPEILARFAPKPLSRDIRRHIEAVLDLRAPLGTVVAPDGKSLYFSWAISGSQQVWKVDGPQRFPVQLTSGDDFTFTRVAGITPDGKSVVVARDRAGEENGGLYLLAAEGKPLRVLQHEPKVATLFDFISDDGRSVYFHANDVDPSAATFYRYELATSERHVVHQMNGQGAIDDHRGTKLLIARETGILKREYIEWDEATHSLTKPFGAEDSLYGAWYSANPGELLVLTAKFGDFRRLYKVRRQRTDPSRPLALSELTPVTPDVPHDVFYVALDPARKTLYYTTNEGGYTRVHALDAKTYRPRAFADIRDADHVSFGAATWDGRRVVVHVYGARRPTASYVWDWQTRSLTQWLVPSTPEIDPAQFVAPTLESYPARDGTKIPMFVRRPPRCAHLPPGAEPCPVVVSFHGGPSAQARAGFSVYGQIFVDAGFVWIEPNVRGSDGYGEAWQHADDGPKRLAVITDIEDAAKYVRAAFAHEGKVPKIGVTGTSYGGYSTLMAMTKFAGSYDAGVANVAIANFMTFLERTAPARRVQRMDEYGDPDKDREALVELSPMTYIGKIQSPLFLIHGANDPRVPVSEVLQIHQALEKANIPTRLMIFPDEGHGARKLQNRVLEMGHTLAFFEAHLMGMGTEKSEPGKDGRR